MLVRQDQDTPFQEVHEAGFRCRFAYLRGGESREEGDVGQDAIAFRARADRLVFALCDGVGQSFCGDLAAGHLSASLVDILWSAGEAHLHEATFPQYLQQTLMDSTVALKQKIETHELPSDLPLVFRQELDKKRHQGSESTYVCGRLDAVAQGYSLYLSFMGDSRLRLWVAGEEQSHVLQHRLEARERWSSHRGPLVTPAVFVARNLASPRLVAYSDGFERLDGTPSDVQDVYDALGALRTWSGADDASYLEVVTG